MAYAHTHQLLRRAHRELDAAHSVSSPQEQFIHSHMAALRACAAVLASVAPPAGGPRRQRLRSAWEQLADLGENWLPWVEHYTASAGTRAALESGQLADMHPEHAREAAQLTAKFLGAVESSLLEREAQFASFAQAS